MARKKNEAAEAGEKRSAFRMSDNGVITFGANDEGVAYSAENSPKKSDTTKELWSKYVDGMTVAQALEAGLTRSNIRRDRRAGFIVVTNPAKEESEEAAE